MRVYFKEDLFSLVSFVISWRTLGVLQRKIPSYNTYFVTTAIIVTGP